LRSRIDIDVDAPGDVVLELACDVSRWPSLLPHYRKVTILSHDGAATVARMKAIRSMGPFDFPVGWSARTWSDESDPDDLQLRFIHTAGPTRTMDVTWHITPRGTKASNVAIVHDFQRSLPLVGSQIFPTVVDRLFVRPIASRTLATFKRLAEAQVAS